MGLDPADGDTAEVLTCWEGHRTRTCSPDLTEHTARTGLEGRRGEEAPPRSRLGLAGWGPGAAQHRWEADPRRQRVSWRTELRRSEGQGLRCAGPFPQGPLQAGARPSRFPLVLSRPGHSL